jgi:hypothetical protein
MATAEGFLGNDWGESSIKANAPQSSGVNVIHNAGWIYIGESDDMRRTLLDHWKRNNAYITTAHPTAFAFEVCNLAERV